MKIKLFTHSDCDGIGCEVVIKTLSRIDNLGWDVDVTECEPNSSADNFIDAEILKFFDSSNPDHTTPFLVYDLIFITDLSPTSDEHVISRLIAMNIIRIKEGLSPICILDHHKTSPFYKDNPRNLMLESKCDGVVTVYNNINKPTCGTELMMDFLMNSLDLSTQGASKYLSLRYFVELVRLHDTWEWKGIDLSTVDGQELSNDRSNIATLAKSLQRIDFTLELVYRLSVSYIDRDIKGFITPPNRYLLIQYLNKESQAYIAEKLKSIFIKDKVGFILAEKDVSEIGNSACMLHPEIDYCVILNGSTVSLRTVKDDVDVSAIAVKLGGGGHSKAAGFPINQDVFLECIIEIMK